MQWPERCEYEEAVQDPRNLRDPELKDGNPRRTENDLFFFIKDRGSYSITCKIDKDSTTFALRCWTKEVRNAAHRYEQISAYLKQVNLPYFVDFAYVPEGIFVNGTTYPITRMEWVEGSRLRGFIDDTLDTPDMFKTVAEKFQEMVADLHAHDIAHGDLQDGNILLKRNGTDIEIKLIDYDTLFVPALKGEPEQIVGLAEYQHPQRMRAGGRQAKKNVDYFSELVIYLSFLSVAEKPELWYKFKHDSNYKLLFSKKDFKNPDKSAVFRELANLSPEVQQLAATLKEFCGAASIDELKPLEDILPKPDPKVQRTRARTSQQ